MGQDVGDVVEGEVLGAVLDEAHEAVLEADDGDVVEDGFLDDGADDGVEAGAVASPGEEADAGGGGVGGVWHGRMVCGAGRGAGRGAESGAG